MEGLVRGTPVTASEESRTVGSTETQAVGDPREPNLFGWLHRRYSVRCEDHPTSVPMAELNGAPVTAFEESRALGPTSSSPTFDGLPGGRPVCYEAGPTGESMAGLGGAAVATLEKSRTLGSTESQTIGDTQH